MQKQSALSYASSLMSKLCSDEPAWRHCSFGELRDDICTNLELILNTRQRAGDCAVTDIEGKGSAMVFGVCDAVLADVGTVRGQHTLREHLERQISQFEPRLRRVSVDIVAVKSGVLHFRIDAEIAIHADVVRFESRLDTQRRTLSITGVQ